jgi:hypothetical protein
MGRQAWDLRAEGYTMQQIADRIGRHISTVSRLLAKLDKRANEQLLDKVVAEKQSQVSHLHWQRSELSEAWRQSKKSRTRVVRKEDGQGGFHDVTEVIEQTGDRAYLADIRDGMRDIRSIYGMDIMPKAQDAEATIQSMAAKLGEPYDPSKEPPPPDQPSDPPQPGRADQPGTEGVQE